jgi:hypothetical protein
MSSICRGTATRAAGQRAPGKFEELTRAYFSVRQKADTTAERDHVRAAWLLVDARHPGLASDLAAWNWLKETVADAAVGSDEDRQARTR